MSTEDSILCGTRPLNISVAQLFLINLDNDVVLLPEDVVQLGTVSLLVEDQVKFHLGAELADDVLALGKADRRWEDRVNG